MRLAKIKVNNYRILKEFELDLELDLSLVIGKNNSGKTSLLSVLDKFVRGQVSPSNFYYDDFNLEFKELLFKNVEDGGKQWGDVHPKGIELYLFIEYAEEDNLSQIKPLFFDLDPDNNIAILKFEYTLDAGRMMSLIDAFSTYYDRFKDDKTYNKSFCFDNFIKAKHRQYFQVVKKAIRFDIKQGVVDEDFRIFDSASSFDINKVISYKRICARRETENRDNDGSLSDLSGQYYEKTKPKEDNPAFQKFEDELVKTDVSLSEIYQGLFSSVVDKVKKFGGIRENETIVKIISTLKQKQLLKGNTTVVYEASNHHLPESYNGLGYLNLISMIFEIETLLSEFRNDRDDSASPADINLLFIEEPEAHTHPQMQYIFIKNIKELLREGSSGTGDKKKLNLQTIVTTHSSHIIAESDFDDIKYLQRVNSASVSAKNLKDLEISYKDEKNPQNNHFKFLKQYLTLNYAEIFFADKAILYEGETERILLPPMMKKIDIEHPDKNLSPMLSQNISLIESGAYAQIFDKFLSFIGIKTLIITDIDSGYEDKTTDKNGKERVEQKACPVESGTLTTNGALKHYYKTQLEQYTEGSQLDFFTTLDDNMALKQEDDKWIPDKNGILMLVYQTQASHNLVSKPQRHLLPGWNG